VGPGRGPSSVSAPAADIKYTPHGVCLVYVWYLLWGLMCFPLPFLPFSADLYFCGIKRETRDAES